MSEVEQKTEQPAKAKERLFEVGVQHTHAGKIYTFITDDEELKPGDKAIVEEEGGANAVVEVVSKPAEAKSTKGRKRIVRRATCCDLKQTCELNDKAQEHLKFCKARVKDRDLPMKMVGARFCEEGKKLIFFFTAEGRVDFRALVKELAQTLKLRIELRQIGARDGAKFIGRLGPCGQHTCCSRFLRGFKSISMGMAKNQGLSPNPTKLTGLCGKLQCCLSYEDEMYKELRTDMLSVGEKVSSPHGFGTIESTSVLTQTCYVRLDDGIQKSVKLSDLKLMTEEEIEKEKKKKEEVDKKQEKVKERKEAKAKRSAGSKRKDQGSKSKDRSRRRDKKSSRQKRDKSK